MNKGLKIILATICLIIANALPWFWSLNIGNPVSCTPWCYTIDIFLQFIVFNVIGIGLLISYWTGE